MSIEIERRIEIDAPAERVWRVMIDVDRWPQWTPSIAQVERLDDAAMAVGTKVRVRQPRLATAVWTVTALEDGRYFEWQSKVPGLTSVGRHRVEPIGTGRVRATVGIEWSGVLAPVIRLFYGRLSERYVEMEAHGLKRRAEEVAP